MVSDQTFRVTRVQGNIVARHERRLLTWLCARLPGFVTPDGLTAFSVFGALLAFLSYAASHSHPAFLWLASAGIVFNWFGDSLDGSLARHRRIERPIYGYFLDHTIDALCNLLIMAGLGVSPGVSMAAALYALIGYYLLCIYVFINNHVTGVFRLSFLWGGPTELRLSIIGINIAMFYGSGAGLTILGTFVSAYDIVLTAAGAIMTLIFVWCVAVGIRILRDPARSGAVQSASMKASSASK